MRADVLVEQGQLPLEIYLEVVGDLPKPMLLQSSMVIPSL
jgi:hypothetical protein